MSYVNKKTRAFRDVRDIELIRKRSDGRMKSYPSATDARCWVDNTEQKRQYILELVSRQGDGKGLSLGKFIPIEAIIDILLANKNAEIKSLQDEIEELKRFIKTHGMNAPPPKPKKAKTESKKPDKKTTDYPDEKMDREKEHVIGRPIDYETESAAPSKRPVEKPSKHPVEKPSQQAVEQPAEQPVEQPSKEVVEEPSKQVVEEPSKHTVHTASKDQIETSKQSLSVKPSEDSPRPSRLDDQPSEISKVDDKPSVVTKVSDKPSVISAKQSISEPAVRESALFRTPTHEELRAAQDFLAGKSFEQQIMDLKKALAEQAKQLDLALAAIEQLENIKDITEDKDERNPRWDKRPGGKPGEAVQGEEATLGGKGTDNLKGRLAEMRDLEDRVNDLKKKLGGADGEVTKLKCKCNEDEKSMKNMQKELDLLRCKIRECEILRCERDCLKCRVEDLMRVQHDYEELLRKTKGFDALRAECCMYKNKYEELKGLEDELNELRAKNERFMQMEAEKELLMQEIRDCECCMSSQEDEIKRLACHIECLTKDLDQRQDEMKTKVVNMRTCLQNKDDLISSSEQKLAVVQDQLRSSIENVSVETTNLRNRIAELEQQLAECKKKKVKCTCQMQAEIDELKIENCRLNTVLANMGDEHVHKMLRHANKAMECLTERLNTCKMKGPTIPPPTPPPSSTSIKDYDELLKRIQQLESELEEAHRLAASGDQSDLIASLRHRILELEGELANCKQEASKLKAELADAMSAADENKILRQNSSKLQDLAKDQLTKLEADNDALRKRLADLQRELENEMKLREVAEELIKEQVVTVDNTMADQEIARLKDELAKLTSEYDKLKAEYDAMKDELERLKAESDRLNREISKLNEDLERKESEISSTRDANDDVMKNLKDELNRLKQQLAAAASAADADRLSASEADRFAKEREELLRQIAAQKKEIGDMLDKMQQPVATDDSGRQELEEKQKEVDKLKSLIDDLEAQLKACKENAAAAGVPKPPDLNDIINSLTKRLDSEEQRTRNLEDQLKKCREENENLRKQKEAEAAAAAAHKPVEPVKPPTRPPSPVKKVEPQRPLSPVKKVEPQRPLSPVKKVEPKRPPSPVKKKEPEKRPASPVKNRPSQTPRPSRIQKEKDCEDRLKELEDKLAAQKAQCEQTIATMKEQCEQEKKTILAQNKASIERLQKSQEDITKQLEEQHDQDLALIRVESNQGDNLAKPPSITNKVVIKKSPSPPVIQEEEPVKISVVKPPIVTEDDEKPVIKEPSRKSILIVTPEVCPCGRLPTILPIPTMPSYQEVRCRPSSIPPPTWMQRSPTQSTQVLDRSAVKSSPMFRSPIEEDSPIFESTRIVESEPTPLVCTCKRKSSGPERLRSYNEGKDNGDKMKSIKKIAELENKLLSKQLQTKQKVDMLQTTVDRFKRELERERQKNSDLTNRYTNQSKTVENMMTEINLVKQENITDKKKLHQLNTTLKNLEKDMFRTASPAYGDSTSKPCLCAKVTRDGSQRGPIPHFRTEIDLRRESKKSRCTCSQPSSTFSSDIDE